MVEQRRFFGKYRGKVTRNKDPLVLGRIEVSVPSILGEGKLAWAMPCVPFAGYNAGFFAAPPINSNVWVEFEAGDPTLPIWSGCFWGQDSQKSGTGRRPVFLEYRRTGLSFPFLQAQLGKRAEPGISFSPRDKRHSRPVLRHHLEVPVSLCPLL